MSALSAATLLELERTAVQLARLAGEHIMRLPLDPHAVQFKAGASDTASNIDPVSNVDREIETRLFAAVHERFPQHAVICEETEHAATEDAELIWVIDPLDGTANYLNGLPLFASSVGVLHRHAPVAGAIWCASTHARRAGVYHARLHGPLSFDGEHLARKPAATWRGLASEPGEAPRYGALFETRVLASAALECALAAAGVLRVAYLAHPAIWDVAAGVVLARAAGCHVLTHREDTWIPFSAFCAPNAHKPIATLRFWRQPVLIGAPRSSDLGAAVATVPD